MKQTTAGDVLRQAGETFIKRNKVYGDNYKRAAAALQGLFPDGIELKTSVDQERYQIFNLIIVKLSRYAVQWERGHRDSIHDTAVYAALLEKIDEERLNGRKGKRTKRNRRHG